MPIICEVRLLQVRREFDRGYSYLPDENKLPAPGDICAIPFGKANRPTFGVITNISESSNTENLKSILYTLDPPYNLSDHLVELCLYFSTHLLCSFGELARAALPSGLTFKTREFIAKKDNSTKEISFDSQSLADLYQLIQAGAKVEICSRNRINCEALLKTKLARKVYLPENATNVKYTRSISLACDPDNLPENAFARFPLMKVSVYRELLKYLKNLPVESVNEKEISERFNISRQTLTALEKRGLIKINNIEFYRAPYKDAAEPLPLEELNEEQQAAVDTIKKQIKSINGSATLLHGVTGSGKTRVMMHLISAAKALDQGVIFLVPEIGLTSRVAKMLLQHFPNEVTILHSGLSAGERHDAWVSLKNGTRKIVLGTRSAIFAPVQNLGLIIMDEEQDSSYNADNSPRYHARDIARFRAAHEKAVLLLASATPSIETFYKANSGTYKLCSLNRRAIGCGLPNVEVVDLRDDLKENPTLLVGKYLKEAISFVLSRGEQCLLFMNRRGYQYSPFCTACGHVITCPNCSVALTVHNKYAPRVSCHYCGYSKSAPDKCPSCGANNLFFKGFGTQRLEEEIKEAFPTARVLRMDADSITQKLSHDEIISDFHDHKADILIGTQMITKGHDFPDVTLVGVVMADTSLYLGDYRASEDTFSLLTQVIGRAGRALKPGLAIIQTLNPEHEIFSLAAAQDYNRFFEGEIALRKAILYPPFCLLSSFTLSSEDENALDEAADAFNERIADELEENPCLKLIVYGPFEPAIAKINKIYRRKFVIKYQTDRRIRELYSRLISWFYKTQPGNVSIYFDHTPSQI